MNLQENIIRIKEVMGIKTPKQNIIFEASKKDILVNKIGFNEDNAETLANAAGPFAVWLGNKLIDVYADKYLEIHLRDYSQIFPSPEQKEKIKSEIADPKKRKQRAVDFLNRLGGVRGNLSNITSIMDWIRVGLNGNVKPYMNMSFEELYDLSREWHDSLEAGQGDFNYNEKNKVLRDYRDENGIGFYWVDLETNSSDEECDRMGHCGRTGGDKSLHSLRRTQRINKDFTLNKSYLTAAVGEDNGVIYQLKGPKNSKPDEKYHPYIVDLILNDDHIQGFGSEYASDKDFKITDLSKEEIIEIYSKKPGLFNTFKLKSFLKNELGIEGIELPNMVFELKISPDEMHYYIDGDWVSSRRKRKTPAGNEVTDNVWFIEQVLSGDIWEFYGDSGEWKSSLEYHVNEENANRIREIIKSRSGDDYDPEETLENLIEEYDGDYDIRNAITGAYSDTASSEFYNYVIRELQSTLEEYGEVLRLNDEGAVIKIDLNTVIDKMGVNETEVDEAFENCGDDSACVFEQLLGNYYDKPRFSLDERWYPSIDDDDFNSMLEDRLGDIE
jgi:hypothetical protein